MDKVIFDGVEYTKASVAAKELRYTSDYLGQLCRAKKIDARLVGRTWFVNLDSVHTHKENKYQPQVAKTSVEISVSKPEISIETKSSRVEIKSVEQRRVARPVALNRNIIGSDNSRNLKVSYEIDDGYLMPKITKVQAKPPRNIIVEQANAHKVRVSKGKEHEVSFQATELPAVALSGKLNVTSYPDAMSEVSKVSKNNDISDKRVNEKTTVVAEELAPKLPHLDPPKNFSEIKPAHQLPVTSKTEAVPKVVKNEVVAESVVDKQKSLKFSPDSLNSTPPLPVSKVFLYLPAVATIVAIIFVGFIFSASSATYVSNGNYDSQVELQLANLLEIFKR